jgi:hypothetical protein
MNREEATALVKSNPRGMLNLIEHGDLEKEALIECCKVAGFSLPTEMCQRVLLKVLITTKDPFVFEEVLVGLSPHRDQNYLRSLETIINNTSSPEIKEIAYNEVEHCRSWEGMGDPDSYEYEDEEPEY